MLYYVANIKTVSKSPKETPFPLVGKILVCPVALIHTAIVKSASCEIHVEAVYDKCVLIIQYTKCFHKNSSVVSKDIKQSINKVLL